MKKTSQELAKRLLWFVVIWAASVAALSLVALLIRWAIKP